MSVESAIYKCTADHTCNGRGAHFCPIHTYKHLKENNWIQDDTFNQHNFYEILHKKFILFTSEQNKKKESFMSQNFLKIKLNANILKKYMEIEDSALLLFDQKMDEEKQLFQQFNEDIQVYDWVCIFRSENPIFITKVDDFITKALSFLEGKRKFCTEEIILSKSKLVFKVSELKKEGLLFFKKLIEKINLEIYNYDNHAKPDDLDIQSEQTNDKTYDKCPFINAEYCIF